MTDSGGRPWVRWLDDGAPDVAAVGRKAATLARARLAGLPVLNGFCLTTDAVRLFLECEELSDNLRGLLRRIDVSGYEILALARRIEEMVTAAPFPAQLASELRFAASRLATEETLLIARSSATAEDLHNASAAGIYTTRTGFGPDAITDAVRDVIRSLYGIQALFYRKKHGIPSETASMAVLVQQQLQPDDLGVLFTTDPLGEADFLLEWSSPRLADSVTDGTTPAHRMNRSAETAPAWVDGLISLGHQATEVLGGPADIEWARSGEEVVLLQLRPVTALRQPVRAFRFALADDDDQVRRIDLRGCAGMHARWRAKHARVRREARRANIRVAACLYVEYGAESAADAASAVIAGLRTSHVFLDVTDDLRSVVIARDTLAENLALMAGSDEAVTVRIRECYTEHASLLSGVLGEEAVLVEHTPGGIKGLIRGLSAANRYLVGSVGEIRPLRTDAAGDQYLFDRATLAFHRSQEHIDPESTISAPKIEDHALRRVAEFTRKVPTAGHTLRLEWCVVAGEPCLLDHSVERDEGTSRLGDGWVIMSPGSASGTAMVLSDLGELEYLSDGNLVSVDSVDPVIASDHAIHNLLGRVRRLAEEDSVIVVAERPATVLALLIDMADAFVFEDGALLSHLAILLREARKPAVVVRNATSLIADGSHVLITTDGMVELERTALAERSDGEDP